MSFNFFDKWIGKHILNDNATFDLYDIWKDGIGLYVKKMYYKTPFFVTPFAAMLTVFDFFVNNKLRIGYTKQEYPIVRAQAALTLINTYKKTNKQEYLNAAKGHLDWLINNSSRGYSNPCWGVNFTWASKNGVYDANTPYITITPYVIEALVSFQNITKDYSFENIITGSKSFIYKDLKKQIDNDKYLAFSYAPVVEPRIVINANSYALLNLSILYKCNPTEELRKDIIRVVSFLKNEQRSDGSWLYYADMQEGNFIDCFHSCFILKNLIKSSKMLDFDIDAAAYIKNGWSYIKNHFYDGSIGLFKRFSITDKKGLVKFDLYDNAEALGICLLLGDKELTQKLKTSIDSKFVSGEDIYSIIDVFGAKRNRNHLRWATMPYLLALSDFYLISNEEN